MRIILQKNQYVKEPNKKIYTAKLQKLIEFRKYHNPYDKKNMDFKDIFSQSRNRQKPQSIDIQDQGDAELQDQARFSEDKFYQTLSQQTEMSMEPFENQPRFSSYLSHFKYQNPIKNDSKANQELVKLRQQHIMSPQQSQTTLLTPTSGKANERQLLGSQSQKLLFPQISVTNISTVNKFISFGFEHPVKYRAARPQDQEVNLKKKRDRLIHSLRKHNPTSSLLQNQLGIDQPVTQIRKEQIQISGETLETQTSQDLTINRNLSTHSRALSRNKKDILVERQKLRAFIDKYGGEESERSYLHQLNIISLEKVVPEIEKELEILDAYAMQFQDFQDVQLKLDNIRSDLTSLRMKKVKEIQIKEKQMQQDKYELSLIEDGRGFNSETFDQKLKEQEENMMSRAIQQLQGMNDNIKEIISKYKGLSNRSVKIRDHIDTDKNDFRKALIDAVKADDAYQVVTLLQKNRNYLNQQNTLQQNALLIAAKRGNLQIFEALLTYIDDVSSTDILDRDAYELLEKFISEGDRKSEMRQLWKKKKLGELEQDEFKYRSTVFLDSLKKPDLRKKYEKIIEKLGQKK